jgi:hypothetical protein
MTRSKRGLQGGRGPVNWQPCTATATPGAAARAASCRPSPGQTPARPLYQPRRRSTHPGQQVDVEAPGALGSPLEVQEVGRQSQEPVALICGGRSGAGLQEEHRGRATADLHAV